MAQTSVRARCVLPPSGSSCSALIRPVDIAIENGLIVAINELSASSDCDVPWLVAPGFIDLQINGIDADDLWRIALTNDVAGWRRLESALIDQGVTAWCPTFISAPKDHYAPLASFLDSISSVAGDDSSAQGPAMLGIHLEGPFLGSALGAHAPAHISSPDWNWLQDLAPHIALITMGAESALAEETCRMARRQGIVVALGHTAPSHEAFLALRTAGATMITHLFNAMSGLHHRHPGLAAWALADDDLFCSLIADGVHVASSLISIAFRSRPDHIVLVTDRVAHHLSHLHVDSGAVRLADGTLAGSIITMAEAIRTCVTSARVALPHALMAATDHPARVLNVSDRGRIAVGARADLVALDDDYSIRSVWLSGQRVR